MLSKKELINWLKLLNTELVVRNAHAMGSDAILSEETLDELSELIMLNTMGPLPSLHLLQQSPEAKILFLRILNNSQLISKIKDGQKNTRETASRLLPLKTLSISLTDDTHNLIKHSEKNYKKVITQLSLNLHSKQYDSDRRKNGPIHIIHFYPQHEEPRGAEYAPAYDSDNDNDEDDRISYNRMTNHGLGSGIFGRGRLSFSEVEDQLDRQSRFKIIKIEKPFKLANTAESHVLTELGKYLQNIMDKVKKLQSIKRNTKVALDKNQRIRALKRVLRSSMDNASKGKFIEEELKIFAIRFSKLTALNKLGLSPHIIYLHLKASLKEFAINSKRKQKSDVRDKVEMPINYFILNLGFDGVVSNYNDTFNRGLIAMNHDLPRLLIKNFERTEFKDDCKNDITQLLTNQSLPAISPGAAGSSPLVSLGIFSDYMSSTMQESIFEYPLLDPIKDKIAEAKLQ